MTDAAQLLRTRAVRAAFLSGAVGKIISIFCGIASVTITLRAVGPSGYGLIATLTGVIGILGFLDFGVGNALIAKVAVAHARDEPDDLSRHVSVAVAFVGLISLVVLVAALLTAFLLPPGLLLAGGSVSPDTSRWALIVFGVAVALAIPGSIGSKIALGLQRGRENNFVALGSSVVALSVVVCGAVVRAPTLFFLVVLLAVPVGANWAQTLAHLLGRHEWHISRSYITWRAMVRMVPEGLPFTVLVLAGAVSYQTDLLVVSYVAGLGAAAGYGLIARIFSALTTALGGGVQQMWASTSHALASGDIGWVRRTMKRVTLVTGTVYALASIAVLFAGPMAVGIWSAGKVRAPFILLLAFASWNLYNFVMSQFSSLLNGAGRVKAQAVAAAIMAVFNLPASIWFTSLIGSSGPLWASLATHAAFVGVPTVVILWRLLSDRVPAAGSLASGSAG